MKKKILKALLFTLILAVTCTIFVLSMYINETIATRLYVFLGACFTGVLSAKFAIWLCEKLCL